ncbi:hypothetical protein BJ546DRAFT_1059509 [Cryomyces antarcticus]
MTETSISNVSRVATRKRSSSPTTLPRAQPLALRTQFKQFTRTAEILVGPGRAPTRFLIHYELLTGCSRFFSAALDSTFAEGLSKSITLPEEKLEPFEFFVHWLYTGELGPAGDLFNKAGSPMYFMLLEIYGLADRLGIEALRNAAVDRIALLSEGTNSVPTPSDTWIVYDGLRDSAPVRALVLDLFAFKKTDNLLLNHEDEWHPRFLRDLVVKLKRPGRAGLARHALLPWRPDSWPKTRACDVCRVLLKPGLTAKQCSGCAKAFCVPCVGRGSANCGNDCYYVGDGSCKPWLRDTCQYHEHVESEECGRE